MGKGRRRVNQRGVPVDGDFVDPVVGHHVFPAASVGPPAANEVTGPGRFATAIVQVQRRQTAETRDVRAAIKISPEKMIERTLGRGSIGWIGLQTISEMKEQGLAGDVARAAPVPSAWFDPKRTAVSIIL